jgi:hypothetical protein
MSNQNQEGGQQKDQNRDDQRRQGQPGHERPGQHGGQPKKENQGDQPNQGRQQGQK